MKFEIFQNEANGKYYYRLKAKNGQIILASSAYETKEELLKDIASIRMQSVKKENFEIKEGEDAKFYFNLKDATGESIGIGQAYASKATVRNGIVSVQRVAPDAPVIDLTR